jgi:hypothetical protein
LRCISMYLQLDGPHFSAFMQATVASNEARTSPVTTEVCPLFVRYHQPFSTVSPIGASDIACSWAQQLCHGMRPTDPFLGKPTPRPPEHYCKKVKAIQFLCFPVTSFAVTKLLYGVQECHFGPVRQPGLSPSMNPIARYSITLAITFRCFLAS